MRDPGKASMLNIDMCLKSQLMPYWRIISNLKYTLLLQVGYSGGYTKNPTYKEMCTGMTGHNEVVRVVFDPKSITYEDILKVIIVVVTLLFFFS